MTAEMVIRRMDDPTKFPICTNFECQINFINNENREDETSFDVDCTQKYWRDELLSCWEDFRKENNLPEDCVTDASLLSFKTCYAKQCYDYRCCGLEIKDNDNNEEIKMNDPVNHPSHYTDGKIEVLDFIEDKKLNFHRGNAVKYICRAGKKDTDKEVEDLEKAVFYLNREIELLKNKEVDAHSFNAGVVSNEYIEKWNKIDNKFHEALCFLAKATGNDFEQSEYEWDITKEIIEDAIDKVCPDFKPLDINY